MSFPNDEASVLRVECRNKSWICF
uniref:Uncharacterized protein n=1 Tax=Lepeophtheirus salmonis TaxID=72036 RepID=A0A0K2UGR8_LEPSM